MLTNEAQVIDQIGLLAHELEHHDKHAQVDQSQGGGQGHGGDPQPLNWALDL
jgi:hypothetical protein